MISSSAAFEAPPPALVITRELAAPRELVFQVMTEAGHLANWWGPVGMELTVERLELRPGGLFHYRMTAPGGGEMWGKFVYRQIVPPERLVYTSSFADAEGNTIRAPFSGDFPLALLNALTFTEQGGVTTLTLRSLPLDATDAEQDFFESMFDSMRQGFAGTFGQLDAYLEEIRS